MKVTILKNEFEFSRIIISKGIDRIGISGDKLILNDTIKDKMHNKCPQFTFSREEAKVIKKAFDDFLNSSQHS